MKTKFSQKQKYRIWERDNKRCVCCGRHDTGGNLQIDHAFPAGNNYNTKHINEEWNGNLVCIECHSTSQTPINAFGLTLRIILMNIALKRAKELFPVQELKPYLDIFKSKVALFKQRYPAEQLITSL